MARKQVSISEEEKERVELFFMRMLFGAYVMGFSGGKGKKPSRLTKKDRELAVSRGLVWADKEASRLIKKLKWPGAIDT